MENPIIFLDIDGVLYPCVNRRLQLVDTRDIRTQIKNNGYYDTLLNDMDLCASAYGFDKQAIQYLKTLLEKTNARIVISSSWKFLRDLETLKALFSLHHIDAYIIDKTSNEMGYRKEDAINDYIKTYQIENYVVLDDIDMTSTFHARAIHCPDIYNEECNEKALCVLLNS